MIFELTQTDSGCFRWMLNQGGECIAKSAKSFPTELACMMEIERIRGELTGLRPAPMDQRVVRDRARRPMASF